MRKLTVDRRGEIAIPESVRQRYGFVPGAPVRIVEIRGGVILVPLTDSPPSAELARELAEWQDLGNRALDEFPYLDADQ